MIVIQGRTYSSKNSREIKTVARKKVAGQTITGKALQNMPASIRSQFQGALDQPQKGNTRLIVTKSDVAHANHQDMVIQLLDAKNKNEWARMTAGVGFPYFVHLTYYAPDNGKFDLPNIFQNLMDAMQAAGYVPDDDYKHFVPVYNHVVQVDKVNPRVEIRLVLVPEYQFID